MHSSSVFFNAWQQPRWQDSCQRAEREPEHRGGVGRGGGRASKYAQIDFFVTLISHTLITRLSIIATGRREPSGKCDSLSRRYYLNEVKACWSDAVSLCVIVSRKTLNSVSWHVRCTLCDTDPHQLFLYNCHLVNRRLQHTSICDVWSINQSINRAKTNMKTEVKNIFFNSCIHERWKKKSMANLSCLFCRGSWRLIPLF